MIVKVQVPLNVTAGTEDEVRSMALIYNEERSIVFELPVTAPLLGRMRGRHKAFFHALPRRGSIEIGEDAPWQAW